MTHQDMTRFWITLEQALGSRRPPLESVPCGAVPAGATLPSQRCMWHAAMACCALRQAVNFVLSNLELMRGGEIFVPKLEKTSIVRLVRILAKRDDFPVKITAIRPGERTRPGAPMRHGTCMCTGMGTCKNTHTGGARACLHACACMCVRLRHSLCMRA